MMALSSSCGEQEGWRILFLIRIATAALTLYIPTLGMSVKIDPIYLF
jgi:hypothetical protein